MLPPDSNSSSGKANFQLNVYLRLSIAIAVSGAVAVFASTRLLYTETILMTWICFAFSIIVPEWITMLNTHPCKIHQSSAIPDSSRSFLFFFVLTGAIISLMAVAFLMQSPDQATKQQIISHVCLTIGSVVTSWWLVHTVFTLRYAHLYYDTRSDTGERLPAGGLKFPEEDQPDYLDFVYFSFNLGVCFQVSDVAISSRRIRRLAWIHSLISFAFNTAIVALSINITSEIVSS